MYRNSKIYLVFVADVQLFFPEEILSLKKVVYCKLLFPKVHLQNFIYQVLSEILQNQILMVLRLFEKNQ
jgi:hypothetical protein